MARIRVKHHPKTVFNKIKEWRNSMGISMDIYYNRGIEMALYSKEYEEEVKEYLDKMMREGYILEWYRLYRYNDDDSPYITFKALITTKA